MIRKKAFSLIELLVVIAIIGILAAITVPAFIRVKEQAFRSSDLSNMNSIRTALLLYKADQGAFPPALLGYATGYANFVPSNADIVPANLLSGALYPKRVDSLEILRPALDKPNPPMFASFTTAVWPTRATQGAGSDPNAYQRFGPGEGPNVGVVSRCLPGGLLPVKNYYYKISGYDVADSKSPDGERTELRYTLFWSGYTVPATCPSDVAGSAADNPRQLGYADPPETTVITWDSFFRDVDPNGLATTAKKDMVLFLGGGAKPMSSLSVFRQSWMVQP